MKYAKKHRPRKPYPHTKPFRWRYTREKDRRDLEKGLSTYTRASMFCEEVHGKLKSSERQQAMLQKGKIACHCVGGISMKDRDLQKLIKKGFMRFTRRAYARGWGGDYMLSRTHAVITSKGEQFLRSIGAQVPTVDGAT